MENVKNKWAVKAEAIGKRLEFGDFKVVILSENTSQEDLQLVADASGDEFVVAPQPQKGEEASSPAPKGGVK